ncbi:uncharacterized protein PSFLO_05358 [Pseudozyma flocculosa]|uniref:Uncharacterized protein n=2 Tax=Pseudozyma flocculosa TaxID=84751 RepID=A0A5C3F825_9BASI|nr:uncharacterized protein PSFLO_05358 [Pseudozyma flocculosa]
MATTPAAALLLILALARPALAVNGRPDEAGNVDRCSLSLAGKGSYTLGLHIAAIFVVFVSSSIGITLPFVPQWTKGRVGRRTSPNSRGEEEQQQSSHGHGHSHSHSHGHGHCHGSSTPNGWWDECFFISKYLGAGVILATAFVHLTYEAFIQLTSPCIHLAYAPTAPAISMASLFLIFVVDLLLMRHIHRSKKDMAELKARRARAKAQLESLTLNSIRPTDSLATGENAPSSLPNQAQASPGPGSGKTTATAAAVTMEEKAVDAVILGERLRREELLDEEEREADAKLAERAKELDVMVIEGGIVFHSVMVGLGLGTSSDAGFVPYFVAIVFHQMFDGFAIGTRMAELNFQGKRKKQIAMFLAYAFVTPVGIALGTGVRTVFEPNDPTTIIAIGVLDSLSAGVLLYGALVDMLAKDFLFGPMLDASNRRLGVALAALLVGAAVMSLLGKWA